MPEVSNFDLKKLICMILKKVEVIEERVNKVYELVDKGSNIKIGPLGGLNFRNLFKPIKDEEDLTLVSDRLELDAQYRENLIDFMRRKADLKLEDIFTPEFLVQFNYLGVNDKKKLKGLLPFEQLFVEIKQEEGHPLAEIVKGVKRDIAKIKDRVRKRKKPNDEGTNQPLEPMKIMKIEENYTGNDDLLMNVEQNAPANDNGQQEVYVLSTIEEDSEATENYVEEDTNMDESYYDSNAFEPIQNEEQLQIVSNKILNDPNFLKETRIHIVSNSDDGECTLQQIFSEEFLYSSVNWAGKLGKLKLTDLVPYKYLYSYLKENFGIPQTRIDADARIELTRIRDKLFRRLKSKRLKEVSLDTKCSEEQMK